MLKLIKETLQDAGKAVKDFLNRIPLAKEQWPTIDFQRPSQLQKQANEEETHKMRDNFCQLCIQQMINIYNTQRTQKMSLTNF